jgi:hypothetical protein
LARCANFGERWRLKWPEAPIGGCGPERKGQPGVAGYRIPPAYSSHARFGAVQNLAGHADLRMTACYAHVVDMAKKNPALFSPVKVG